MHVTTCLDFDREKVNPIFDKARYYMHEAKTGQKRHLRGKVMASLFFEPSTRTRVSFEAAMKRLGGEVINFPAVDLSSMKKGESFKDTIRTISQYVDVIVARTSQDMDIQQAVGASSVPVISGGDGAGEHPTQALLDLFTIQEEKRTIDGLKIMFDGDLRHARTIHSLITLLDHYDVDLYCSSPSGLQLPPLYHPHQFEMASNKQERDAMLARADVLYLTRPQTERWDDEMAGPWAVKLQDDHGLNRESFGRLKKDCIIMHPMPCTWELPDWVKDKPQCVIWKQLRYGMFVRMALLRLACRREITVERPAGVLQD
jgi:aspartate carbamoyltransferase